MLKIGKVMEAVVNVCFGLMLTGCVLSAIGLIVLILKTLLRG